MCQNKSYTQFPMKVMSMGLLEYIVNFYNAEEMRKVSGNVPCRPVGRFAKVERLRKSVYIFGEIF